MIGSEEEETGKRLQEIAAEDSDDESDSAGSVEVGKKRKRNKSEKVEGELTSHWEELISQATHRMEHGGNLTDAQLNDLRKTKEDAEAQLATARNQDVDGEKSLYSVRMTLIYRQSGGRCRQ